METVRVFESCARKILRAEEHFADLRAHTAAFLNEKPYTTDYQRGPEPDEWQVILRAAKEPDPLLGVIAGEISYQLRSALDYSIGELIEASTGKMVHPDNNFMFPIFIADNEGNDSRFESWTQNVSAPAKAILRAVQPYRYEAPHRNTLAILDAVYNEDKHRSVQVLYGGAGLRRVRHSGVAGRDVFRIPARWVDNPETFPAKDGTQVFGFSSSLPNPNVEVEIEIFFGFGNPWLALGIAVDDFFERAIYHTKEVIASLTKTTL